MGAFGVVPSHRLAWICLVFWFGLFFGCHWDGANEIFIRKPMQRHVGVDGMGMRKHVGAVISGARAPKSWSLVSLGYSNPLENRAAVAFLCA
jgi:hypothetical protein